MTDALQITFWVCTFLLAYVYVGYPLVVYLLSRLSPRYVNRAPIEPYVTVLITAYNEEAAIGGKLENTLQIDYPAAKLEILVASDGSSDRTDEIARSFEPRGVKLFRQEGRVGKTATQNAAVERAAGEIVLFSDATTYYPADVFAALLPNFADPTVGCVAGRLEYVSNDETHVARGARGYWSYETFLKIAESRVFAHRRIRLSLRGPKVRLRAAISRGVLGFPDLHQYLPPRASERL